MNRRKPQEIADIRGQWENYALTHGLPMRCETNIVFHDGSCIVCSADNGQACQRATPPTHGPQTIDELRGLIRECRLADAYAARTGDESRWDRAFDALCRAERAP